MLAKELVHDEQTVAGCNFVIFHNKLADRLTDRHLSSTVRVPTSIFSLKNKRNGKQYMRSQLITSSSTCFGRSKYHSGLSTV
jgi:hypothetical protein